MKATKLADVLDALHLTAAAAETLSKTQWGAFARLAQVPMPSVETQHVTVELLTARETAREWVARAIVHDLAA